MLAHVGPRPLRSPVRISHRPPRGRRARETSNYKGRLRRDVSHGSVRIRLHREALGGDVEDRGGLPLRPGIRQTGLQHRQPAPLHLRSAAPGARHRVLPDRLRRPLQEDEGIQRVLPPLLRRQRDPHRGQGREEAPHHQAGHPEEGVQEALRGVRQRVHRGDDPPLRDPGGEHGPQHLSTGASSTRRTSPSTGAPAA